MLTASSKAPSATPTKPPFAIESQMWHALAEDSGAAVTVFNSEGNIEYANSMASCLLAGASNENLIGRRLADFFEDAYAQERMGVVSQVIASGKPVVLQSMCKGISVRSAYRPMRGTDGEMKVLVITRTASRECGAVTPGLQAKNNDAGKLAGLTGREFEILKLIGLGLSTADIAKKLHRSVKTIEWHRVSLGEKLGVTNRVELARIAIAAGLVSADSTCAQPETATQN